MNDFSAAAAVATITSTIGASTRGLVKTGPGILLLSSTTATNAYTGATTIGAGTLRLGVAEQIPNGSSVTVGSGITAAAVFDLNSFSETINGLSSLRSITLQNNDDVINTRSFINAAPSTPNAGVRPVPFSFGAIAVGTRYKITVKTQPELKSCDVVNGEGVLTAGVRPDIVINCNNAGSTRFDLVVTGTGTPFYEEDVVLVGGGLTLVTRVPARPGTSFTPYHVGLSESGWTRGSLAGLAATQADMKTVLGANGRTEFVCQHCDKIDPLKTNTAKWADSPPAASSKAA